MVSRCHLELKGANLRCPEGATGEIVVCARDREQLRLGAFPDTFTRSGEGDAQLDLSDMVAAAVEGADIGGFISDHAMMRFELKF